MHIGREEKEQKFVNCCFFVEKAILGPILSVEKLTIFYQFDISIYDQKYGYNKTKQ